MDVSASVEQTAPVPSAGLRRTESTSTAFATSAGPPMFHTPGAGLLFSHPAQNRGAAGGGQPQGGGGGGFLARQVSAP